MLFYDPVRLSWCSCLSLCIISRLLRLQGDSKPFCNYTHRCFILEEQDFLCSLIGLQEPPHATSGDIPVVTLTRAKEQNLKKQSQGIWSTTVDGHHPEIISFFRIILLLPLLCCCCHFYLHQSRLNCFTSTSQKNRWTLYFNLYLYTDVLLCDMCSLRFL